MFWYIVGFCAFIVSLLSLWVNASAFGMEEMARRNPNMKKCWAWVRN